VLSPASLLDNDYSIVISAAQYYANIVESAELLQIEKSRIIRELVL
jgi:hypothetical protein